MGREVLLPSHAKAFEAGSHTSRGTVPFQEETSCSPAVQENGPSQSEPVAIIGFAMRLPGGIHSSDDLWEFLSSKKSALGDVPENRFNINGFYDPAGSPGTIPVNKGYFLQDVELQQFDTNVFPIPRMELERLDPGQRQLLQVAYECLENAGVTSWRGSSIGCYIGEFGEDWADVSARETQHRGGYRCTGLGDFAFANRVSYELDLHGPSVTIKTACSSSLVGLDLACRAVQNGQCDSALVGGTSLIFSPTTYLALKDQGVLSPNGQCRSFDAAADGYARGEAVNMVLVKRLSHALRDNDPIRAIIRGTGVNIDGKTNGMLTPSPTAQAALIRHTYKAAGIKDLSETAIVECHGTGTPVGDPIETEAIAQCFGDKGVVITSVKPNLGHSEAAAGLTSLIKCILALEHNQVLPNINFEKPNPKIPFEKCKLHVPTEVESWPKGRAERISVNSFGIGGVNAHVILESPRQFGIEGKLNSRRLSNSEPANGVDKIGDATSGIQIDGTHTNGTHTNGTHTNGNHTNGILTNGNHTNGTHTNGTHTNGTHINGAHTNGTHTNGTNVNGTHASNIQPKINGHKHDPRSVLLFSAHDADSLDNQIDEYRKYTESHSTSLSDLAYTLAFRRERKPHRAYIVTDDTSNLGAVSDKQVAEETAPRIAWVFTGQGAQWPEMGADLIDSNATFQATIRKLDEFLRTLDPPLPWTIEDELRKGKDTSRVHRAELGHPTCVALQIALVDVLRSWGIVPDFVLGHSSGETAAAYASGALTAEAAMYTATRRGISNVSSERKGSMAAVGLGKDEVEPYLLPGVDIACENSQCSVTLSGDTDGVEAVLKLLKEDKPEAFARMLRVEKAFHSHHMREYGPSYEDQLKSFVHSVEPEIPFYSSVTGKRLTGDGELAASYWRANMESPVLFNSALRSALGDETGKVLLIEIGPHPALAGPIGQILRDIGRSDIHIGTLVRGKGGLESLLHVAGKLYQHSAEFDISAICPPGTVVKDLPRYSWRQDTSHWGEPRVSRDWRFREHPPHALLGNRVTEMASQSSWRKVLALEDALWLTGHEVNGHVVFPAAGYIAMIGEALRQLSGETTYSLKNIRIASARVLEMDKPTELVTSLKPISDTSDSSPWYEFTITSSDGTGWVKNCYGQAMASVDKSLYLDASLQRTTSFPRNVGEKDWYQVLRRVGFNYTGLFEGMSSVSAATTSSKAKATVAAQAHGMAADDARCATYTLHPAVIDQCFQLFTVAACHGLRRNTSQLAVPTFIEQMVVSPSAINLDVTARINKLEESGSWTGDLVACSDAVPVLSLKGMRTSVLTKGPTEDQVPVISQLEWKPHSDFVGLENGLHPRAPRLREWPLLEELIMLCSFDHLEQIKPTEHTPEHLIKALEWMKLHTDQYQSGANVLISRDLAIQDKIHEQRLDRINAIVTELSDSPDAVFSTAVYRLFMEAPALFSGEAHALHILLRDNVLSEFYDAMSFDSADAIRLMANTNPHLRVLEIGAGTGGTTARVLEALTSSFGERLYSLYSYTDISAGFMTAARERFASAAGIEYGVLDITKDPAKQGFDLGTYDLVIGANVLHATPCLNTTLRNANSLLRPGGRLFLEELCPDSMFMNYVMGFLSGWWLGADDGRVNQPWVSPERWTKELVNAGFQEPEAIVLDSAAPYHLNAGIIASRAARRSTPPTVALLCYAADGPYVEEMQRSLAAFDVAVETCIFGEPLPACDTISLLDVQEPAIHNMSEETFKTIMGYFGPHKERLFWVTQASQVNCEDPRAAMVLGLARTARNEHSRDLFTIEIGNNTTIPIAAEAITDIMRRAHNPELNPKSMDPDYEYAIDEGEILVPRLHWQTAPHAYAETNEEGSHGGKLKQLTMTTPGLLHTMMWRDAEIKSPKDDEILVETRAVGLNFRDVVLALGIVEGNPSEMGFEASGIVRAVGPGVQRFSVGDRVVFLSDGCFATHLTLQESLCVKLDDTMSFIEGATVPCVYATALMALMNTSNLRRGQSILIHAACGGVGLAAVQIAQLIGAEVYCTVGSESKRAHLLDNYGIDASHVFTSRDASFLPGVMRATNNRGVDVVLNSLSGDLLHASWKCVAEFGIMVEIGKRDFQRRAQLAMETFEANRTFVGLDLRGLSLSRPERAVQLLERSIELIRSGALRGPTISQVFPAAKIQDAYRTMQAAKHIGKIVIEMPKDLLELTQEQEDKSILESSKPAPSFRSDRSYLLVGGLGGLGRAVATWMVEHGARNLVFLSRSAQEGPELQGFLEDLRSQGCKVLLVAGSVSSMDDVQSAVDKATAIQPVAGVINLSMVLKDAGLSEMAFSDWTTAVEPKVKGTWNLHDATASSPLDFFLLFSSQSGLIGLWGQANYAAANTFLDAFVQYRHRNGLAASVIDVGLMGDVGYVAGNQDILQSLERTGMYVLQEQHLLDAITLALKRSHPPQVSTGKNTHRSVGQVVLGLNITKPISSPTTRVSWKRDARMSIYHNLEQSAETSNSSNTPGSKPLKSLLEPGQSEDERTGIIAKALAGALANFLIKDEDSFALDRPLESLGMDSLVAMEVRNWIRQQIGVETSTFTIVQSPSLTHLGNHLRQAMDNESKE